MKLDTLEQRHKIIDDMIKKGFDFEESLICDEECSDDLGGAMTLLDNLAAVEDMICVEEIFLGAMDEMGDVKTRDRDEKEKFIGIFCLDGLNIFNQTVLLPRLRQALTNLDTWSFRTLIKEYDEPYDV